MLWSNLAFVILYEIRATFMYEQFPEVMNMLWARMLRDNKKNWRRVYKVCLIIQLQFCVYTLAYL